MATKQLYKALGVSGYEHRACWRKAGTFFLSLSAPQSCHQCPKCGNREVIHRGTFTRTEHGLPVGKDRTHLFIDGPRLECRRCEQVLNAVLVIGRINPYPKGIVPPGAQLLTCGIDLGKYLAHWVIVAWSEGAAGHILDYGRLEIASTDLGVEKAILLALREFHEQLKEGFPVHDRPEERRPLQLIWIDAGYMTDVVCNFVLEHPGRCILPAVGRGAAQQRQQWYNRPTSTGSVVRYIGEGFHINLLEGSSTYLAEVDADHWKSWVHQRLVTPMGQPGAMTLFAARPAEHLSFAKHLTAESKTEEYVAGKGVVTKWERVRKNNHWLDALYNACAVGHYGGVRLLPQARPPRKDPPPKTNERKRIPWINLDGWNFRRRDC